MITGKIREIMIEVLNIEIYIAIEVTSSGAVLVPF